MMHAISAARTKIRHLAAFWRIGIVIPAPYRCEKCHVRTCLVRTI